MNIAYFFMVHKLPNQFKRLLRSVYDRNNTYLVHVDKKMGEQEIQALITEFSHLNNVYFMKPHSLTWGGWSLVDMELKAIQTLLSINTDWEYFINLSGQDFPLHTQVTVKNFLSKNVGVNFIQTDFEDDNSQLHMILASYFIEDLTGLKRFDGRSSFKSLLPGMKLYSGSQWKMLHRSFCNDLFDNKNFDDLVNYFKFSFVPDETFFPTLIMNSSYADSVFSSHLRFFEMDNSISDLLRSPKIITSVNADFILNTTEYLFARKFDETIDSDIISKLESKLNLTLV